MATLLLVRHGQASFGAEDYDELSKRGVEQSVRLGDVLRQRGENMATLWSGPMCRHQQTAQSLLQGLGIDLPVQTLPMLAEFDHHEVIIRHDPRYDDHAHFVAEMKRNPNAKALFADMFRDAMARWVGGAHDADYREPWPAFQQRVRSALATLVQSAQGGESHLVVTSGGVISVVMQTLLDLSTEKALGLNWRLANASITRIQVDAQGRVNLLSFNEHNHFLGTEPSLLTWR